MAEYIEREVVRKMLESAQIITDGEYAGYCMDDISIYRIPAADVAPVVHGRWIKVKPVHYQCSICGVNTGGFTSNYCHNCGAKMDKEATDGAVPVVQFAISSHGTTANLSRNVRRRKHGTGGKDMREILFRGKRMTDGKWVYGDYHKYTCTTSSITPTPTHYIMGTDIRFKAQIWVDPDTVGQYTGLTDKNGVKIFEGDIVLVNWFGDNGKFVVCYEGGSFFPYQIGCKFNFNSLWDVWFQDDDGTIMEVIGNINDNPNLLD